MPQYKVVELREGLLGGKMSGDKLEKVLNEHGQQGWALKAITAVEVKGRVGPGGVEGVLVTFERPWRRAVGAGGSARSLLVRVPLLAPRVAVRVVAPLLP